MKKPKDSKSPVHNRLMAAIIERKPYSSQSLTELVEFATANHHHPLHSRRTLERFLTELTSSENLVFDYHLGHERILTAALIDEIQNPSNSANLEIFGFKPGPYTQPVIRRVFSDAQSALPSSRSGIEFSLNDKSVVEERLLRSMGFAPLYTTYEMQKVTSEICAVPALSSGLRWQTLRSERFEDYYDVLKAAFAKNLETSIPPLREMKKSFEKSKSPPTLLLDGQRIAGFISIAVDDADCDLGEVHMIGLHPDYRRRGLGSALLARALQELGDKKARLYKLTVAAANSAALQLYIKFGFEIVDQDVCMRYARM